MPAKRVHWADEEEGPAFVPPPTPWTPPLMLTNTDDSNTESPPPPTPQSVCGNLSRQYLNTPHNDFVSCVTISPSSTQTTFIPANEVPVTPSFYPETGHSQQHTNIDNHSLVSSSFTNRHSPQQTRPTLSRCLDYNAQGPYLLWDVCEEPTASTVRLADGSPVPDGFLQSAATSPPSREMRIQCIWHTGWRPLSNCISTPSTTASPPGSPQYITVLMVIKEMHKYLQRKVTAAEYARFAAIPGEQDAVSKAFYARCERHFLQSSPSSRNMNREQADRETQCGLRRVDCLRGHTVFRGLTASEDEEGLWHVRCTAAPWLPAHS